MGEKSNGKYFPSTHWSQVHRAGHDSDSEQRYAALQELIQRYYNPLQYHLQHVKGIPPQDADDLLHNFLYSKFLKQAFLSRADQNRGRFRTFLLNSLDRYVISQYRKDAAAKRSPEERVPLDEARDRIGGEDDPHRTFHVQWAKEVIRQAAERMKHYCQQRERNDVWLIFKKRQIDPALDGMQPVPYDTLVEEVNCTSPVQVQNLLVTGKRMYTRSLYAIVREYAGDAEEAEKEVSELRELLST